MGKWRMSVYAQSFPELVGNMTKETKRLIKEGYDSIFLYSDEGIAFIYLTITRLRSIPKDFGLVTLDGRREAITHVPQITSISHATTATAGTLIREIVKILEGKSKGPGQILVRPEVYSGTSLRKIH